MMISPRPPSSWWCRRRALARTSSTPVSLESSIHSGASDSRWQASRIFGQRFSATRPLRSSSPRIRACEATNRWASSDSDISSENSATELGRCAGARPEHRVLGDVRDQRRLSHRRARGDDDQVARLKAARQLVEVLEARRRAGQRRLRRRQPVELVGLLVEDLGDRAELLLAIVVRHLEHRALGPLDQIARRRLARQHARLDLVGGGQQRAQLRVVAHDLPVLAGVTRRPAPSRRARRSPPARRSPRACRAGGASRRPSGGRSSGRSRTAPSSPRTPRRAARGRSGRAAGAARRAARAGDARRAARRRAPTSPPRGCAAERRCVWTALTVDPSLGSRQASSREGVPATSEDFRRGSEFATSRPGAGRTPARSRLRPGLGPAEPPSS